MSEKEKKFLRFGRKPSLDVCTYTSGDLDKYVFYCLNCTNRHHYLLYYANRDKPVLYFYNTKEEVEKERTTRWLDQIRERHGDYLNFYTMKLRDYVDCEQITMFKLQGEKYVELKCVD